MSQLNKKFKALILDCDGTIIPNHMAGLPSQKVTDAINKVSSKIHVGIATARPKFLAVPIMKHLNLSGPSIISGGSQIIDGKTFNILKEERIDEKATKKIISVFGKFNVNYLAEDGSKEDAEMKLNQTPKNPIQMAVPHLDLEIAEKIKKELSTLTNISAFFATSWQKGKTDLVITNSQATKQHGIFEVAKILGIDTKEIIGVGDGYNDFPLLMACGLKVAMGNAVDDLKAIADFIAPSVEDDGVVEVIERFINR